MADQAEITMKAVPMVLRSREALGAAFTKSAALPLTPLGATYTMAQEAAWLDGDNFAVGRWDGSLSLFNFTDAPDTGPRIAKAVNGPAHEGIQMIAPVSGEAAFFSSNDGASILLWGTNDGSWSDLEISARLKFPQELGVANSGAVLEVAGARWFACGHANGRVTLWQQGGAIDVWSLEVVIDVRSAKPVNPWGLTNIRGISVLPGCQDTGYVITGSEDGNLTIVRIPDGKIIAAAVYNPNAQRGINSVAVMSNDVQVANCAVGSADFNLWTFRVDPLAGTITLAGKADLVVDGTLPQVFNFDVVTVPPETPDSPPRFLCSTEEGALWMGALNSDGSPQVLGYEMVSARLGSALCVEAGRLVVAGYDLKEFAIGT